MQTKDYKVTKWASYITAVSMSVVINFSPLLFVTFRQMYNISYTLLGLLVVMNFSTQLLVDLLFTFYTHKFNVEKTVRNMPFITFAGLMVYALMPMLFPKTAYLWISLGTIIFSVSSGLSEVLLSPVVAAMPSENPERDMSILHSAYGWGVVLMVVVSTAFFLLFGTHNWNYLAILWSLVPLSAFIMFRYAKMPDMNVSGNSNKEKGFLNPGILLCVACIFFGGASECTMNQWASGFMENAMGIPKLYGDMIGVALFALLLGMGRTLYSKYGKNILNVMLCGMLGATICYVVASLSLNPVVGIISCVATGLFTSMLWPGTIICIGEKFPFASVAVYALMASGGDMGASIAPQLVGIIADKFALGNVALNLSNMLHITTEQIGMRAGLLVAALFPLMGMISVLLLKMHLKNRKENSI